MQSSFFGLNVATQGLFTARTSLDIVNHNISNANTPGYSRQYGIQSACRPLPNNGIGMMGTGSEILNIGQHRNSYIDVKFWNNASQLGEYSTKSSQTSYLENILNELKDTGITKQFSDVFDSLQKLSTNPSNHSYKTNFVDMSMSFTRFFNDIGKQMRSYQREANFSIKTKIDQINYSANQLAIVNDQIANSELTGVQANDLRDKRANIVDELSKIINVRVDEMTNSKGKKTFVLFANGQRLVEGVKVNLLETRPRKNVSNPEDEDGLYDIYWKTGQQFNMTDSKLEGELKGYIDMRDGNNENNFKGRIKGSPLTAITKTIQVDNPVRTDLPTKGIIKIDGAEHEYTNCVYDKTTDTMTFTLTKDAKVGSKDVAMGEGLAYKGIPYYMEKINHFIRTVARKFNEIHAQGKDKANNPGIPIFTYSGYTSGNIDYNKMTLDNFKFSSEIKNDLDKLLTTKDYNSGKSANDLLLKMLALKHDTNMFDKGEPDNYIQALVGELGIDKKQADSFKTGQENLNIMIKNQRLSYSGVDLNEETTNMIKFQQAYNMSAKMISVFDEIYEVTINRLGS